jgi:hypothetical protein
VGPPGPYSAQAAITLIGAGEKVDVGAPKSDLTLDNTELRALVSFLEENHEPFQQGARPWIALNGDFGEAEVEQVKGLFANPDPASAPRLPDRP